MEKKPIKNKEKFFNRAFKIQIVMIDETNFFQTQLTQMFSQIKARKSALSAPSAREFNKDIEVEQRSFDCFVLSMTVLQICYS